MLVGFAVSYSQGVSEKLRYILVQRDESSSLYPITNNSTFTVLPEEIFVISEPGKEDVTIDLKEISAFGITTRMKGSNGISDAENSLSQPWRITMLNGTVIRSSESGSPDVSGLEKGQIYIITIGGESYKYMAL